MFISNGEEMEIRSFCFYLGSVVMFDEKCQREEVDCETFCMETSLFIVELNQLKSWLVG